MLSDAGNCPLRNISKQLDQQLHGGIDEIVPQISRFEREADNVRTVDDQRYLRDAVRLGSPTPTLPSTAASLARISYLLPQATTRPGWLSSGNSVARLRNGLPTCPYYSRDL
jgi:hypothetical protein